MVKTAVLLYTDMMATRLLFLYNYNMAYSLLSNCIDRNLCCLLPTASVLFLLSLLLLALSLVFLYNISVNYSFHTYGINVLAI